MPIHKGMDKLMTAYLYNQSPLNSTRNEPRIHTTTLQQKLKCHHNFTDIMLSERPDTRSTGWPVYETLGKTSLPSDRKWSLEVRG